MIGTWELLLVAFIIFMLFGAKKIPEFARGWREAREILNKTMPEFP